MARNQAGARQTRGGSVAGWPVGGNGIAGKASRLAAGERQVRGGSVEVWPVEADGIAVDASQVAAGESDDAAAVQAAGEKGSDRNVADKLPLDRGREMALEILDLLRLRAAVVAGIIV